MLNIDILPNVICKKI